MVTGSKIYRPFAGEFSTDHINFYEMEMATLLLYDEEKKKFNLLERR